MRFWSPNDAEECNVDRPTRYSTLNYMWVWGYCWCCTGRVFWKLVGIWVLVAVRLSQELGRWSLSDVVWVHSFFFNPFLVVNYHSRLSDFWTSSCCVISVQIVWNDLPLLSSAVSCPNQLMLEELDISHFLYRPIYCDVCVHRQTVCLYIYIQTSFLILHVGGLALEFVKFGTDPNWLLIPRTFPRSTMRLMSWFWVKYLNNYLSFI